METRRLWAQVAKKIEDEPLSGWAYLVTPHSLSSEACQEELAYALQRALESKGEEFPLIGLLHHVSIGDVPLALRVRLCVNLANPDWIEEVRAGVLGQPPRRTTEQQSNLVVKVHRPYGNDASKVAVEIRPRFGELTYWRIAVPADGPAVVALGHGPANGGGLAPVQSATLEGTIEISGIPMRFVGAGDALSAAASAYAVFDGEMPARLFFGTSREAFGTDMTGTLLDLSGQ